MPVLCFLQESEEIEASYSLICAFIDKRPILTIIENSEERFHERSMGFV